MADNTEAPKFECKLPDRSLYDQTLTRLADRLGVKPCDGSYNIFAMRVYAGPVAYDVLELAHALLDKMEAQK